jgi:hypothetical protein
MIDIERLASEAGFTVYNGCCDGITADLKRFAALVRNEVLEEAATVSDQVGINALIRWKQRFDPFDQGAEAGADACSEAIRALKAKT